MTNVYSNIYWQSEFTITQADLDRLENYIVETGQAHDLTVLAKRIIRGRLRYGDEVSPAAIGLQTTLTDPSVRLWNPASQWEIGNHAIVAVGFWSDANTRHWHVPYVGEIVDIEEKNAVIRIDALGEIRSYGISASSTEIQRWRQFVKDLVDVRRDTQDLEIYLELILLEDGDRIVSQLLDALQTDERFVRLSGRWFLRRLAVLPSTTQLQVLAWIMLNLAEPQPTEALLPLISSPISPGDSGLFGLYLALREQPHLFANADPGQRPRWVLAGPPPGPVKAGYAAFDPETYHILCEPEEPITAAVAQRLWQLELFRVICAPLE